MPELPEVETIRLQLDNALRGLRITGVEVLSLKSFVGSSFAKASEGKGIMIGKKVIGVERRGKMVIIRLSGNRNLLIHLKLTGRLLFRNKDDPPDDWQRVVISLSGGKELRFCDLRKFGWIRVIGEIGEIGEIGVEPFDKEFTVEYLRRVFSKTSRAIKIVLVDQEKIAGIGNIYANEALFLAKIDPQTLAKELKEEKIKRLKRAVLRVLKAGIKYRGASDQYYLDALGRKGAYQEHFLVYRRDGKKCFECGTKIKRTELGGRGTFYCPRCQA